MKLKRIAAWVVAAAMSVNMLSVHAFADDTTTTYSADKEPASGQVVVGISGSYDRAAAAALLARINEIRAEAKSEGVVAIWGNNDAYYSAGNVANGSALGWNNEVENYAMIRAAEYGTMPDLAHTRPDGTASKNFIPKTNIGLENAAWYGSASDGLEGWYEEKAAYLQHLDYLKYKGTASEASHPDTSAVWGHYSTLIANEWKSVGLGWFVPTGGQCGNGGLAGEFSDREPDSTTAVTRNSGACIQNVVFNAAANLKASISGADTVAEGAATAYTASVALSDAAKGTYGASATLTVPESAGTWSSSDTTKATVASDGTVSGVAAGTATIAYSVNNTQLATKTITVEALTIQSVSAVPAVSTAAGTAPTLPATVHVTYTNTTQGDVAVTWAAVAAAQYHGGATATSFEVEGTVTGWTDKVKVTVNVEAATKASAADPAGVTTAAGTAPTLPEKATVTWSNGDTTQEAVTWDTITSDKYHGPAAGTFNATGKVAGFDVTCAVTVTAATATSAANPAGVTTAAGTAPTLPEKATVTWSNGDTTEETVTWASIDSDKYHGPAATSFNATGTVKGYSVSCAVTVTAATASSAAALAGVTTAAGTAPVLPTQTEVTLSNGDKVTKDITWDTIDASKYHGPAAGSFNATGTVEGLDVTCAVTVTAATASSAANPAGVTTAAGTAPTLPAQAEVTLSNGDKVMRDVTWASIAETAYHGPAATTFDATGTVEGISVTCAVSVTAATASSAAALAGVTTAAGTAPVLPTQTEVTLSNGDKVTKNITWDTIDASKYHGGPTAGSFNATGTVEGLDVTCAVTVSAATVQSVTAPAAVTAVVGVEPVLPETLSVAWSNGDTTQEAVSWNTMNTTDYDHVNSFTVNGTCQGTSVSCSVSVVAATIVSVTNPDAVTTPAGTAPTLPAGISASFSNGVTGDVAVTWAAVAAAQYHGGATATSFEVEGTVTGWTDKVKVTVNVEAATKASAADPAGVTTAAGTAPTLPEKATVTWSNGDTTQEAVTWDTITSDKYHGPAAGTFNATGKVAGFDVTCAVTVTAATASSAANPAGVTTAAGTAPTLPEKATVTWSNGDTTQETVVWDTIAETTYHGPAATSFDATGKAAGLDVTCAVTVTAATATSAANPADVTTASGTAPALTAKAAVTWSNGDVTNEDVTWSSFSPAQYQGRDGNTFDVAGTVAGKSVTQHVIVTAATVTSVANCSASTVATIAPTLPTTAEVTWSNGDKTQEAVTWSAVPPADYASAGTFTVNGTCKEQAVTCSVDVVNATIDSVTNPAAVTTPAGTAPTLPNTVSAHYTDNTTHATAVVWDSLTAEQYHGPAAGSFTVEGTVTGWESKVSVTVNVEAATAVTVVAPAAVTTPAGSAPALPATVEATLTNGDTAQRAVTWNTVDPASYHDGGNFTVSGMVDSVSVTCDVTVEDAVVAGYAGTTTTNVGVGVTLPTTVPVTWSNGDVTNEVVTWDAVDPAKYAVPGTFTVNGTFTKGRARAVYNVSYRIIVTSPAATAAPTNSGDSGDSGTAAASQAPLPTSNPVTGNRVPATGDTAPIGLLALLMAASIAGMGGLFAVRRKNSK